MIIAQISDSHVTVKGRLAYDRFDTAACLARCVRHILRSQPAPDAVLATGDLADGGSREEYRRLREALAPLTMPVYVIPGNHDERAALCAGFRDHAYLPPPGEPVRYAVEQHPVRLLALDTVVPGADGGALDAAQLDWLAAQLTAAPRRPTVIFMHHPPFDTGFRALDRIRLDARSAEQLGAIVVRHRQIERIVCGHVHRSIQARWCGTTVSVCPSTAYQALLDLEGEQYAIAPEEPSAYQLHFWNGAELVTHTLAVNG